MTDDPTVRVHIRAGELEINLALIVEDHERITQEITKHETEQFYSSFVRAGGGLDLQIERQVVRHKQCGDCAEIIIVHDGRNTIALAAHVPIA